MVRVEAEGLAEARFRKAVGRDCVRGAHRVRVQCVAVHGPPEAGGLGGLQRFYVPHYVMNKAELLPRMRVLYTVERSASAIRRCRGKWSMWTGGGCGPG